MKIHPIATEPFAGQKPGTSGLRSKIIMLHTALTALTRRGTSLPEMPGRLERDTPSVIT